MIQIKCTQVTYEALGRVNVTFTENFDMDYISSVVRLISDTARVTDVKNVTIDSAVLKDNNLEQVREWYERIKYVEK